MSCLHFREEKVQIPWSNSSRTMVCVLFRFFRRDKDGFCEVFTSFFKDDLSHFDGVVPFSRLNTQWSHLKSVGDPIWNKIHIEIPFPAEDPWLTVVARIKERANAIGVSLVEKEIDDTNTSGFKLNPAIRHREKPTPLQTPLQNPSQTVITPASTRTLGTQFNLPSEPPTVTPAVESLCTAGGKTCFWCCLEEVGADGGNQARQTNEGIPSLLYRWSNVVSQGVNTGTVIISGLFSNTEENYFLPKDISQSAFDEYVTSHVSITRSASPFISTFKSILAPVHRAIRAREGAIIHIIDPSRLEMQVYSAKSLVKDLDINIRGYRGVGEYLVWGKIPTPAIVCSFTISSLARIASEDAEIGQILQLDHIESSQRNRRKLHRTLSQGPGRADRRSGLIIGRLLGKLKLPSSYIDSVALGILFSWRFSKQGEQKDYLKGAQDGHAMPMIVPSASAASPPAATPSSLERLLHGKSDNIVGNQGEHSAALAEDSDDTLYMTDDDDDYAVLSIESSCPGQRTQSRAVPRVEFFDPRGQRWSENGAQTSMEDCGQSSASGQASVAIKPEEEPEHMQDDGLDALIEDLMGLAE